jgi:hypothetical protein
MFVERSMGKGHLLNETGTGKPKYSRSKACPSGSLSDRRGIELWPSWLEGGE